MSSTHPTTQPNRSESGATPPGRPVTLIVAVWGSLAVAVVSAIGAVVMLAAGRNSVRTYARDLLTDMMGGDAAGSDLQDLLSQTIDEAYHKLVLRAVIILVVAALVLLMAIWVRKKPSKAARIRLAVPLVAAFGLAVISELGSAGVMPGLTLVAAGVTAVASVVALVALFLPATNRYSASLGR